ncbi:ABC transporter substrate-binding protein, partial [Candidatus Poribacteria bacterium]|nr:ABC transporter substrate-binding protein [Candidatus Poribacteria bacterium]
MRRTIVAGAVILSSLLILVGCAKATSATPSVPAKRIEIKYAKGFKVEYLPDGCKKVTDGEGQEFILIPRGKKVSGYEDYRRIEIPVRRVVALSTTQVCLLRPLGVLDSVIGVTTQKERWHIEKIRKGIEKGRIELVGSGMGGPDFERILALKPDVVFMYTGYPTA